MRFEVHLVDPGAASTLRSRRRQPQTDRLDARWLTLLLARDLLSKCEAWLPAAEIQRLPDRTRLRKALAGAQPGSAQRLHEAPAQAGDAQIVTASSSYELSTSSTCRADSNRCFAGPTSIPTRKSGALGGRRARRLPDVSPI